MKNGLMTDVVICILSRINKSLKKINSIVNIYFKLYVFMSNRFGVE